MVPEEAHRARHRGDGRLRVRELQVQPLLEDLGQRGFLRERYRMGPFLLPGPMRSTHEDDEVIRVPHDIDLGGFATLGCFGKFPRHQPF